MIKKSLFLYIALFTIVTANAQYETYTIKKAPFSNDRFDEFSPVFYENSIVFSTNRNKGAKSYSTSGNSGFFNIYVSDTVRKKPKVKLFSKKLKTILNDGPVCFNATRDTIYFTRNRLVKGKTNELSSPWNKLGIYSAVLIDGKWTNIKEFRYNSEWYNVSTPALSPDGKRLYFASDNPEGYGGSDIFYCNWKNGFWDNPVNMGPVINTAGNEAYPHISPSGEFFFSSDGHPGLGGKDIFLSRYEGNKWLKPVALDPPINSEFEDFGFISDTLMTKGYFSTNRNKSIDIYHFTTSYPQVFYKNFQKEDNFCYSFNDSSSILVDTLELKFVWNFGDGKTAEGPVAYHCYAGPGEYSLELNIVDKKTNKLFFTKIRSQLEITKLNQAYIEAPAVAIKGNEIELSGTKTNLPGYIIEDFNWNFGDSTWLHGDTVMHGFEKAGDYEITLFLTLRSEITGIPFKTSVTRPIKIVNNKLEREYFISEAEVGNLEYNDYNNAYNLKNNILFSAEADFNQESVFCIELLSSDQKMVKSNSAFRKLPDKYNLKERTMDGEQVYSYTIERQSDLMKLYPAFKEVQKIGFNQAKVKVFYLTDPAEKDLFEILQNYDISTDNYFDRSQRLTTNAYIMLDQIFKFLNNYPELKIEIGVHTDNIGYASTNLNLSKRRASILRDYLINRGIESRRLTARGYGESKPITSNAYEFDRKMNRRVEFTIIQ